MGNYSQILNEAYEKFLLLLGGKKVPASYRINIPYQEDRSRHGKSSPKVLSKDVKRLALEQNFDLEIASIQEIKKFMESNMLGIDCSGFVYHTLNYLLKKIGLGDMEKAGFPPASQTNSALLTSDKFSNPITKTSEVKPGDIIKLNSIMEIPHSVLVLEKNGKEIIYAHSSFPEGVKKSSIKIIDPGETIDHQDWEDKIYIQNWNLGDGVRRLKALK